MKKKASLPNIQALAEQYAREVRLRTELGDARAEYHAQAPKIMAYKLLIDSGLTPKEAIAEFQRVLEGLTL
jgi:hypothetical protein